MNNQAKELMEMFDYKEIVLTEKQENIDCGNVIQFSQYQEIVDTISQYIIEPAKFSINCLQNHTEIVLIGECINAKNELKKMFDMIEK